MAATAAEVTGSSWLLSSGGIIGLLTLLLLFILLTALCNDCRRHSYEVQDTEVKATPPLSCTPGRQVKLEEALGTKENPATKEIQGDEDDTVSFTPWRSHLGAPYTNQDVKSSTPLDSAHIP
ncbi:hypothetical protein fugu_002848 [Takifugu bimaculatus]|uniref:Uncharacterized protein n=1 Tax=Takifugu bimaculatus TaxID=433685 RepID=A0A4Z2BEY7_9TELE|nr:hypothetical protein fugu_002848 [Takifugu bimaculatus]